MDVFHHHNQAQYQQQEQYNGQSFSSPHAYSSPSPQTHAAEEYRGRQYGAEEYRGRAVGEFQRPGPGLVRPAQVYSEDSLASPPWGPQHISRYSQQSFETPVQSRSASPTLVSGRATPLGQLPRPKHALDSWPSTPMVSFFQQLWPFCFTRPKLLMIN